MTSPRPGRIGLHRLSPPAALLLISACIIPDRHLQVEGDFENSGPVRLLEPIPMSEEANAACSDASSIYTACPVPPATIPFGLIDFPEQQLCVCPNGDDNALLGFEIFAEDPDFDEDTGRPTDTLLAAFLLAPPDSVFTGRGLVVEDLSQYVAYENYLDPSTPGRNFTLGTGTYIDAIERPTPLVRSWTIGQDRNFDLCNDNDTVQLAPGLHELVLIVTDRPWYVPVQLDDEGKVEQDETGAIARQPDAQAQLGVPDLPAGATYAKASFVFNCGDGTSMGAAADACNCAQEEGP